jgi:large subunit ribosomal protein LP0
MSGADKASRKQAYFSRLIKLLDAYQKVFICGCDHVASHQMQKVRKALRGKAEMLMGKNTMIRKAIRGHAQNNARLEALLPFIKGNVGFVFTNDDLAGVKKALEEQKVSAPAKIGNVSPCDVFVPPGMTGLDPSQTSFFQALNIPTKINKGQIEIVNDVHLLKPGSKVGASEANLLAKLDIKPFRYGLVIKTVYDNGSIYEPKVLEITDQDIIQKFQAGVKNLAAISMAVHEPNLASVPHMVSTGYKNVLSIALSVDFAIKQLDKLKSAAASAPKQEVSKGKPEPAQGKPEPKKPEPEPEPEEDVGMGGLFD